VVAGNLEEKDFPQQGGVLAVARQISAICNKKWTGHVKSRVAQLLSLPVMLIYKF
jgi:hypothetical protein